MSHFTYAYDGWKLIDEPRHEGNAALDSLQANPHSDGGDRLPCRKRSQYDPLGTEEAYYVQGPGADEPLTRNPTIGQISYYHQDGNANVTAMTDGNGNIIEHYAYDPFGNVTITSSTGMVMSSSSVGNRFLFSGREYIAQIGVYDYRNRVYSPGLGRFLQTDPIRFNAGDINIYRYCENDPVNWVDPLGLASLTTDEGAGTTTFSDDNGNSSVYKSDNTVMADSKPGAEDNYKSDDVYVAKGPHNNDAKDYGPNDIITTDDDRDRWLHGGGRGLDDPSADNQGSYPTHGCTRLQNKDIKKLADQIRQYKKSHPGKKIPYARIGTPPPRSTLTTGQGAPSGR